MMRYSMGLQVLRRFSTETLPERNEQLPNTSLKQTGKQLSASRLSEIMEKSFERQIENHKTQNSRVLAEFNASLALNFAEEENGKTAILRSYANPSVRVWAHLNALSSLGLTFGLISGMFSFYTIGGIAVLAAITSRRAAAQIMAKKVRKIVEINLLNDGQIEVVHSKKGLPKGKAQSSIMDPKDFNYGISVKFHPWIDSLISQKGVWCSFEGKKYLIIGQTQVNNHLLNQIL